MSEDFKNYWYNGLAEITSYTLEQERYGEIRDAEAVLIYVTEDFLPEIQVKADHPSDSTKSVLKLNQTKKFFTGIYSYSIMNSVFYPLEEKNHALKVTTSVQEWCGHVYAQLNNRDSFKIKSHSYFESEADQKFEFQKTVLEDELWTQVRVNPEDLPSGELLIIPSFEFIRLKHKELKPYNAIATTQTQDSIHSFKVEYPSLNRSLTIWYEPDFPYHIIKWEEQSSKHITKATKKKQLRTDYWSKNTNADSHLRDSLQLNFSL
ncbi:septum formation inhibitor Maf [uncultured Planktosalinus sp.]|uniref:septum formation inhibitor Maf n=1 Tax=uncultured Planktosalinus sp. TaxID=1810935 RepID=UPI0030DB2C32